MGEDLLTVEVGDQIHVQRWLAQKKNTDTPSQAEQELLRLEEQRRQAILHNDAAAMDRLLAEEFIVTDNEGRTHDRADELSLYKNKRRQTQSWEASDLKVYVYGDSAVVNERVALKDILDGRMRNTEFRLTDFWVKQDGRWQLTARHGTPIAQPELLQARQALSDDTAIRKHVSDYVDAYNAHDPEKMSALFTDDQDTVVLPGRLLKGKPALRELFIRRHSSIAKNSHLSRTVENIRFIKPDLAVVDGTYDATGMSDEKGNRTPALRAWVTEILIKTDNQWRGVVFRAIPLAGAQSAPVSTRSSGEAAGRLERKRRKARPKRAKLSLSSARRTINAISRDFGAP